MSLSAQTPPPIEPGVSHELAKWRAAHYSDVRYKLNLTLEKMSPVLKGTMEIRVKLSEPPALAGGQSRAADSTPIILDWRKIRGSENLSSVSNVVLNGKPVPISSNWPPADAGGSDFNEHLIFRDGVVMGENVIKLDFTSPILTSGSAITRYIDKEDGAEYIYSLFVPSDASTAFPVFDQPDLKARFKLTLHTVSGKPDDSLWRSMSNAKVKKQSGGISEDFDEKLGPINVNYHQGFYFEETEPISTYVFAFTTGPFKEFVDGHPDTTDALPKEFWTKARQSDYESHRSLRAYVRKSQAAKLQPHAAEVFRLNREGIKSLETYFDYKFPFPKYDLVLIPEFPFRGMEHAGATFLREDSIIFPQEPTKNDYISRANLIFHETAHQWFGDTVTMKWFDDLWLKEGFAEFMAYKTLEKVMPQYNAWKIFYERNKQAAYLTDSTKGTTPIYQPIANLNAAKSAYGNIVYRKAPSFLRQAEFYLGEDKFRVAVRAFLKKHEYANAGWEDLVKDFEAASKQDLKEWSKNWVTRPGLPTTRTQLLSGGNGCFTYSIKSLGAKPSETTWRQRIKVLSRFPSGNEHKIDEWIAGEMSTTACDVDRDLPILLFSNLDDFGYGIFLLDDKSRDYVLKNIQNEKDDFLRTMMWGSLWDSIREAELDPTQYVELVVKNIHLETDESTIQTLLGRVSTAMKYYLSEPPTGVSAGASPSGVAKLAGGQKSTADRTRPTNWPAANAAGSDLATRLENTLIDRMQNAVTPGQKLTYYRAFLNIASSENARRIMKRILKGGNLSGSEGAQRGISSGLSTLPTSRVTASITTRDRFDIVSRLIVLGDPEAMKLLAELENTETSDEAKRYAYAARAGIATAENKAKYWNDFVNNKEISESWIEAAAGQFNNIRHSELTLPYLERALAELPNLKRSRKIFFVNAWLAAFIGGHRSEEAFGIVNKFLARNPNLDKDLRLKILENVDLIERAVKIRG